MKVEKIDVRRNNDDTRDAPEVSRGEAMRLVRRLQYELKRGNGDNDEEVGQLIQDLVDRVRSTAGLLLDLFTRNDSLAAIAGPTTHLVLRRIEMQRRAMK